MKPFKTACQAALLAGAILGLSGCDTINNGMQSMGRGISNIHFGNPFKSNKDDTAPAATASTASQAPGMTAPDGTACPPVTVVDELRTLNQFKDEQAPRADNKISSLTMTGVTSTCTHNDKNTAVDIDIAFSGMLGPQAHPLNAAKPSFAYPYFVAITLPDGSITAKEVFGVTVPYEKGQQTATQHEHMRQVIPNKGQITPVSLVVGFQLTDSQLAYNRSVMGVQNVAAQPLPAAAAAPVKPAVKPKPKHKKPVKRAAAKPATAAPAAAPAPVTTTTTTTTTAPASATQDIVIPAGSGPITVTPAAPTPTAPVVPATTSAQPAPVVPQTQATPAPTPVKPAASSQQPVDLTAPAGSP